jgi:transcriptional antiterminator RfaH
LLLNINQGFVTTKKWMLVYSKPRHELKLAARLAALQIDCYCPTIKTMRQWSDRKVKIEEPLFKSYVFVYVDEADRETIFHVPGFSRFVFWLGKPVIVRDEEIAETKNFLNNVVHDTILVQRLEIGKEVRVTSGPLKNTTGKLFRIRGNKATLQIDSLGTIVQAEIALTALSV